MEKIKCSLEEHKEIDAIIYCPECRIYMCNKCQKTHSSFIKTHHPYTFNNDDLFTGYCKEKNHQNKLEFFCINHNQLCCTKCIIKIDEIGYGQHKDCNICRINKIKDEKNNKLKDNIKCLKELENNLNESIEELRKIFIKIEKDKEIVKLEIQKIFTKLRKTINKREDE